MFYPVLLFSEMASLDDDFFRGVVQKIIVPSGQLSSASEAPNDHQSDGPQPSYCMRTFATKLCAPITSNSSFLHSRRLNHHQPKLIDLSSYPILGLRMEIDLPSARI